MDKIASSIKENENNMIENQEQINSAIQISSSKI
jgi:hypothetical protein